MMVCSELNDVDVGRCITVHSIVHCAIHTAALYMLYKACLQDEHAHGVLLLLLR